MEMVRQLYSLKFILIQTAEKEPQIQIVESWSDDSSLPPYIYQRQNNN